MIRCLVCPDWILLPVVVHAMRDHAPGSCTTSFLLDIAKSGITLTHVRLAGQYAPPAGEDAGLSICWTLAEVRATPRTIVLDLARFCGICFASPTDEAVLRTAC
jgi:hypothetical protein